MLKFAQSSLPGLFNECIRSRQDSQNECNERMLSQRIDFGGGEGNFEQ